METGLWGVAFECNYVGVRWDEGVEGCGSGERLESLGAGSGV